jgi:ribonucleoside-triphosphate reductase (thioredoxin)
MNKFQLSSEFIAGYADRRPPFGFNGLGELVFNRTYSRVKSNGSYEKWHETLERVVNATYNIQRRHMNKIGQSFDLEKAQGSAQQMFDRMWHMKFLPPGRGLWAMGTELTEKRDLFASLFNCGFVSTKNMKDDPAKPFKFLMDMSMLGVGVGFDVLGAGSVMIHEPGKDKYITIEDSREGWVNALEALLRSYFIEDQPQPCFNYNQIRPAGLPIRGFGGVASGPGCLQELMNSIRYLFIDRVGTYLTITDIVDIMNLIGKCVIAGNVRRTAEIAFGPPVTEYLDLKNPKLNARRLPFAWTSNNSVMVQPGSNYDDIAEAIKINGEPGLAWLNNMRMYGRMGEAPNFKDMKAEGGNPCLEQTLESYELCCLVETFPTHHQTEQDFLLTLKYAYLYAKTVSLCMTHWKETNTVMNINRRIGCSVSGIADWSFDIHELKKWLQSGYNVIQSYDKVYSKWFSIPRSIKTTSVKPSGTVSLLAGVSPGMHWPQAPYYYRRVRLAKDSPFVISLELSGYHVEKDVRDEKNTVVVRFPIASPPGAKCIKQVSMWEQLSMAAFLQSNWADNQVSCTVTFDPVTEGHMIASALNYFQYQLKGVSFLPRLPSGAYAQMPYEEIDEDTYHAEMNSIRQSIRLTFVHQNETDHVSDRFCDGETCQGPLTN